jgi:putative sigma-54 modulation protein
MKFEYTGRHLEVTPAIRQHVEEHFEKINHLFGKDDHRAHVIIEVERGQHRSEIVVKWRHQVLTATTTVEDMYLSLSQTIAKIEKQALKIKNKVIDKSHKAKKAGEIAPKPDEEIIPTSESPDIINITNYLVKPMTAEEASILLEEEDNHFYVFRDATNLKISVIYKREDGNFGLIQP